MIIVVEGSDNAGKTTLALSLAKKLKAIYVKTEHIPPNDADVSRYDLILNSAEGYGNGYVVSDRHHVSSEPIYGPIIRGRSGVSESIVDTYLPSIDVFVYCRPNFGVITKTMNEREQMAGVDRGIARIVEAYDEFFEREEIKRRTLKYDWTKDSEQALIEEIKRRA